ncbi:putative aldo-keto reductase [Xylariomycetidae sp. FL2044]|nr:putative aldo-keto reductase [Xylariomycetidae sp. FL2044]
MPNNILTRPLGKGGPRIPALGLGLMGMSIGYGPVPSDEERFEVLDRAHELGCRHWDTAGMYGDSEELVGKWFERTGKRNEIFLATKCAVFTNPDGTYTIRNEPEHLREDLEKSLRLLKTDCIDLFYVHRFSGKTPIEIIMNTLKTFVEEGKVRYLGLSECGADTLRRASRVHPVAAFQIEYSPFFTDIEKPATGPLLRACRELGITTVAYSPLGRGMLAGGRVRAAHEFGDDDVRSRIPWFDRENLAGNLALADRIAALASAKGCTPAQITLAWVLRQGGEGEEDIVTIPGTKKIKYLEENLGANDVVLTPAEDRAIREAIEKAEVRGQRAGEALMAGMLMDTPPLKE